jgi:hypothetical protein
MSAPRQWQRVSRYHMTGIIIYKNTPWWRLFHFHCPPPHCSLSESFFFRETTTGHKINRYFLVTCWKGVTLGNYKRTVPMSLTATLGSLPSLCGHFLGETRYLYSVFQRDRDPVFWVWRRVSWRKRKNTTSASHRFLSWAHGFYPSDYSLAVVVDAPYILVIRTRSLLIELQNASERELYQKLFTVP